MATTAIAEVANPGQTVSAFRIGPFKVKHMRLTGGSSAGTGTTAWAADDGVSFTAAAAGFRHIHTCIPLGPWLNADQSLALTAGIEIAGSPAGSTVKVHSHGSNTTSALQDLTSDAYTVDLLVLGFG